MCSIGKHPNSYSFSREALPGFLAYSIRDLVFLGSTFLAENCCRQQEPPAMGTSRCFCFAATEAASSHQQVGPAHSGAQQWATHAANPSAWFALEHRNCPLFLSGSSARPRGRFRVRNLNSDVEFPILRYFCVFRFCLTLKVGSAHLLPFFSTVVQVLLPP